MSRRKRKPKVRAACPACRRKVLATPAGLLQSAADALNAVRAAGMDLQVRHGALTCEEGLILGPLKDAGFVARTRLYTPFSPGPSGEGDGLDD